MGARTRLMPPLSESSGSAHAPIRGGQRTGPEQLSNAAIGANGPRAGVGRTPEPTSPYSRPSVSRGGSAASPASQRLPDAAAAVSAQSLSPGVRPGSRPPLGSHARGSPSPTRRVSRLGSATGPRSTTAAAAAWPEGKPGTSGSVPLASGINAMPVPMAEGSNTIRAAGGGLAAVRQAGATAKPTSPHAAKASQQQQQQQQQRQQRQHALIGSASAASQQQQQQRAAAGAAGGARGGRARHDARKERALSLEERVDKHARAAGAPDAALAAMMKAVHELNGWVHSR